MKNYFEHVRNYLLELGYPIEHENEQDGILILNKESEGLKNLIIVVTDSIVIVEQFLTHISTSDLAVYKSLLIKNRDIVHGALALDESGTKIIFRDTLQVENLDRNEIEATINSLVLLLSEYSEKLITFNKL